MKLIPFWNYIPQLLFPRIERVFADVLTEEHKKIISILEVLRIEESLHQTRKWTGRPTYDWMPFARFFVAKGILNVAATCDMIARVEADINLRRILAGRSERDCPTNRSFLPGQLNAAPPQQFKILKIIIYLSLNNWGIRPLLYF